MANVSYELGKPSFFKIDGGRYVSVELDPYPENPRDFYSNLGTFYTWSNSFISIDHCPYAGPQAFLEDVLGESAAGRLETMQDVLQALRDEGYAAKGVYRFSHGGTRYAIGDANPFGDSWDSAPVGFALVSPEKLAEEGQGIEQALVIMQAEIEEYTAWVNGDVWLVTSYDERGEELEGGLTLYGLDDLEVEFPNLEPIDVSTERELAHYATLQQDWTFHEADDVWPRDCYERGGIGIVAGKAGEGWKIVNMTSRTASAESFDSPLEALEAYEQYVSLSMAIGSFEEAKAPERDLHQDILAGKWRVHLVHPGETYGKGGCCAYEFDEAAKYGMGLPMVQFFDMSQDAQKFPDGQFVASYFLSTLLGLDGWAPDVRDQRMLVLDGDVPNWTVYKGDLTVIADALWEIHDAIKPDEKAHGLDADISEAKAAADAGREERDENQKTRPGRDDQEL